MTLKESLQECINNINLTLVKWVSVNGVKRENIGSDEMKSIIFNFLQKHLVKQGFNYVDIKRIKPISYSTQKVSVHVILSGLHLAYDSGTYYSQKAKELESTLKQVDYFQVFNLPKFHELTANSPINPEFSPQIHLDLNSIRNINF